MVVEADALNTKMKVITSMQIIGPAKGLQFSYRVFYIHNNLYLSLGWLKKVVKFNDWIAFQIVTIELN